MFRLARFFRNAFATILFRATDVPSAGAPPPPRSNLQALTETGTYLNGVACASIVSPFTSSGNCGSSCDNGCILCSDGSYIGFYDASCFPPSLQTSFGVVVTASGQAQVYNLQPEYASCSSVTPILGQCGTTQARVGRAWGARGAHDVFS